MKKNNRVRIFIWVLAAAALFTLNFPFPISKTERVLEINTADKSDAVNRRMTFRGTYQVNLFGPDRFTGNFKVSGYADKTGACDFAVSSKGEGIECRTAAGTVFFGEMYSKKFLRDSVILMLHDGVIPVDTGTACLVSGAENREDALHQMAAYSRIKDYFPNLK